MRLNREHQHAPHGLACFESSGCYHWVEVFYQDHAFVSVIQSDDMSLELKPCPTAAEARSGIEAALSLFNAKLVITGGAQ